MDTVTLSVLLASITAYGATVTKVVDAIRKFDTTDVAPKWIWNVLALLIGVLVAYGFDVNFFGADPGRWSLGHLATGLAIGASGSAYHELFDALSGAAKVTHAKATAIKKT